MAADLIMAGVWFAFACTVLFVAVYSAVDRWWRHDVGWTMVALDFDLFLILLPSLLHYVAGWNLALPAFAYYYAGTLFAAGLITLWRGWVVCRVQVRGLRERRRAAAARRVG
jgi:hypothetical protein